MYSPFPIQPLRFLACLPWFSPLLLSLLPALIIPALWPSGPIFSETSHPNVHEWHLCLTQMSPLRFPSKEACSPPHPTTYTLAVHPLPSRCCQSSCLDFAEFLMFKSVSLLLPFCLLSIWEATLWRQSFHVLYFPRLCLHLDLCFQIPDDWVYERKSRAKNPDGKHEAEPVTGIQMRGNRVETHSWISTGLGTPEEEMERLYGRSLPSEKLAVHLGRLRIKGS